MGAKEEKEKQEKVNALVARYQERLEKRVASGKDLPEPGNRRGRLPTGVAEKDMERYVALREQLGQLKDLRRNSVDKLREIKKQMDDLRGGSKPTKKKAAKK
jgi:hypothetical protein